MISRIVLILIWLVAYSAQAQTTTLQLMDVLSASKKHTPEILEQMSHARMAQGKILESRGAFDLLFKSEGFDRAGGFYDGRVIDNRLEQPLRPFGATIFGGYRISDGNFPIYEDIHFTNTGGEAKVGIIFSLLRERAIDARRVGEFNADMEAAIANLEVWLTKIGVQQRAAIAYWRWVVSGNQLEIYRELLNLAEQRQVALERKVETGQLANIVLVENQQILTQRRSLVARAEQKFQQAINALAFYYRDEQGEPLTPDTETLPIIAKTQAVEIASDHIDSFEELVKKRPELSILSKKMAQATKRLELNENQLLPSLDVRLELARDVGAIAEGGISRDDTETIIGFNLSQPIQNRAARGRLEQSRAEVKALKYRMQAAEDQLSLTLRDLTVALETAQKLVDIAQQEVRQATIMQKAEQRRFQNGNSDLFVLNQREQSATNAHIRLLKAQLELFTTSVNYYAATLELSPLGLEKERL